MSTALLWFRNDLRLTDNLALQAALEQFDTILPVYVFDEQWLIQDQYGFDRTGPFRLQFLLESLQDLKSHLNELGSDLLIRRGKPEQIIPALMEEFDCAQVYASKEYTDEELKVERALEKKVHLTIVHNSTLIHPDDVVFDIERMPEVFTAFRKKVERYSRVRDAVPSPSSIASP
ncbi:MAG: cryptochrome DASH, partial [Cyanothece sp. SIO1E1]|nr:cryptochrome DASH [Cyanothece sp. SIO1E1]